jgi:hypothetical protein
MDHFYLPLAKTTDAKRLFDKLHNDIHQDNNEVKTDRFGDSKITQVILYLLNNNEMYYDHIRILMIPIHIKNRCTIAYTDNHQECIFLIPDVVNDPKNININEIEDLSYVVIKQKFSETMEIVQRMRNINNPVQETVLELDEETVLETTDEETVLESDEEKYPETTDEENYPETTDEEKYPETTDEEKYPETTDEEKYPETTDEEKYPETTTPPSTPISNTYTPITVVDNMLFNGYVSD